MRKSADIKRALLLLPSRSYRVSGFIAACSKGNAEIIIGVDDEQISESLGGGLVKRFNFADPVVGAEGVVAFAEGRPFNAVIAAEEEAVLIAAHAAARLGVEHNSVESVMACRDKNLLRVALSEAGLLQPSFRLVGFDEPATGWVPRQFPCVVKPTSLSGSCGVIRANDQPEFIHAFNRVKKIALINSVTPPSGLLVEDYLPGMEIAIDALIHRGEVHLLAVFVKPDPLCGPYFPETIYLTLSQDSDVDVCGLKSVLADAVAALGLSKGPVHAEFRVNTEGIYVIEVATRSIGGQCGSCLRFSNGKTLEEIILEYHLGETVPPYRLDERSFGVMMLPVPRNGVLKDIVGLDNARNTENVDSINITIPVGQPVESLPEGRRYLGFIFASSPNLEQTESALRKACGALKVQIK